MSESAPPADWQGTEAEWDEVVERNRESAEEEQRQQAAQAADEAQAHADEMARDAEAREEAARQADEREKILDGNGGGMPDDWKDGQEPHVMLTSEGPGSSEADRRTE